MENLPKDVLNCCVCKYLSLRDIFSLACTSKHFLGVTSGHLVKVREMYAKWFPERCYLEALRHRDEKCMEHFEKYNKIPSTSLVTQYCRDDNITNLKGLCLGSDTQEEVLVNAMLYWIIHGSWKRFDELARLYPKVLETIIEIGFCMGVEPTLRHKSDLIPYIGACCKRKLYRLPNFTELIIYKCIELDDYDMIQDMRIVDNYVKDTDRIAPFLIFCDDPRFADSYRPIFSTKEKTLLYGNRELQLGYEKFLSEREQWLQQTEAPKNNDGYCILQ